ncbi:hypothetical protein [Isoptericola variabilis]|uniref:Uncharacterized protein n=1 Tax=Isoptericola variabilis (strain 225) TaxID=743718 RepID=F6FRP6_ISOV2|nr:hypothetical protein [Isoptericola variabilis]AEG42987.1 hypothetical protein Isova_0178 [Isoptericola variabilis 225]TWH30041.1 hypothetical protein L600_003300000070 [Isoptericola variabilis J7]
MTPIEHTPTRTGRPAVVAMGAGLALTVVAVVVPFLDRTLLADHVRAGYPTFSAERIDAAVSTWLAVLTTVGVLAALSWATAIWAVRTGRRWARPFATALFVLGTAVALTLLLIRDTSGDTGLPPSLGWLGTLPAVAGLVAVGLLWRR